MSTRRSCLVGVNKTETTNAGLWLDKFIKDQKREEDHEDRRKLVEEVADMSAPTDYVHWFDRWERALRDAGAACRVAEVLGRMVVGLGDESVLEASVALHHTYGVPYIPGSALKGVAARLAREHLGEKWRAGTDAYKRVFGDTGAAGWITFFDAFPLPAERPEGRLLYPDIMTVHHKDYYEGHGAPPADWDSPTPIPFLSATGRYLVALLGPPVWVDAVFRILEEALLHLGVGAKTSSGYGRLRFDPQPTIDADQERADRLIKAVQALKPAKVAGSIRAYVDQWRGLDVGLAHKRRVAEAIARKAREAGREQQFRDQPWYKELLESLPSRGERS